LAFLRKEGNYSSAPTPDLILLDLNMPRVDGRQVLAAMVADEKLSSLPVVVLTTSSDDEEILKMYKLRCSSYIVKPVDFEQFLRVVRSIADYWFTVVVVPTRASAKAEPARAGA
jgi:two-component system response regulator